ncbi:hypothetical protein [Rossellomorea marisflavi]
MMKFHRRNENQDGKQESGFEISSGFVLAITPIILPLVKLFISFFTS